MANSAAAAAALLPRGERYGRYQLLEQIGKGGMAEIFRAVTGGVEGLSRQFVIKRIRAEKSQSREFIRMFCEEARLCAMLHHPNIVEVYDFGQIDGSYFLAMEYLHGKDLSTVMRAVRAARGAVPPSVAAFVAHQAAVGLHHAHALIDGNGQPVRIVHRDVTPSNIMLLRTGAVKILDFGIAKDVGQDEVGVLETDSGQVKGKLAYLSPEQVRCQPLDGRADVFALGVVLWEMLTGQRLFSADNEFQTMRNVLILPVAAPSTVRPGIPAALDAIVARALERDREKRYATAAVMGADLEQLVHNERFVGQSIPQLLETLFGEEPSGLTPTPLPEAVVVGAAPEAGAVSVAVPMVPRRTTGSDGGRSGSSERRIPLGLGPAGAELEVSMEIVGGEVTAGVGRPGRSRATNMQLLSAHRLALLVAGAALAACLFGVGMVRRASHLASVSAQVAAPASSPAEPRHIVPTIVPLSRATALPLSPEIGSPQPLSIRRSAQTRPSLVKVRARGAASQAKPARHRSPPGVSADLTINPFR